MSISRRAEPDDAPGIDHLGQPGQLVLVPHGLDHGVEAASVDAPEPLLALPPAVLARAAALGHWLAEDARSARRFLKRVSLSVPLAVPIQAMAIREMARPAKGGATKAWDSATLDEWLQPLQAGHDLGLLSEAGLPAVADPGREVVARAHARGFRVDVLPGASSITLAVAASGLSGQSFAFVGYLPQDSRQRRERIVELEAWSRRASQSQFFIEVPYRNQALFQALLETSQPGTRVSVGLALATPHARTAMATVAQWRERRRREGPAATDWVSDRLPAVFGLMAAP